MMVSSIEKRRGGVCGDLVATVGSSGFIMSRKAQIDLTSECRCACSKASQKVLWL